MSKRNQRDHWNLHSDVCGCVTFNTWDNRRYFVTVILTVYTYFTVVYLIRNKSEVPNCFKISKVCCDNGGEYVSNNFDPKVCRF